MCGICGIIKLKGNLDNQDLYAMEEMFLAIESRGNDASGIAYINNKGYLTIDRHPIKARQFIKTEPWKKFKQERPNIVIAHTRLATTGHQDRNRNNHPQPSLDKKMALVHNGVIFNHLSVSQKFSLPRRADVDTEVIMRLIERADGDLMAKIQSATSHLRGSYAVALLNQDEPDYLYLWRYNNPIHVAYLAENDAILFASEEYNVAVGMLCYSPAYSKKANEPFKTLRPRINAISLEEGQIFRIGRGTASLFEKQKFTANASYTYSSLCRTGNEDPWEEDEPDLYKSYPSKPHQYSSSNSKNTPYTPKTWNIHYRCYSCSRTTVKLGQERWRLTYTFPCEDDCPGWYEATGYTGPLMDL